MIIGITGHAQHGKDTIGDLLVNEMGYTRLSFAEPMKREVAELYRPVLIAYGRELGCDPATVIPFNDDAIVAHLIATKPPLVRKLMQVHGTDIRRKEDPHYWVHKWLQQWRNRDNIVATDVRFLNEANAVRRIGGVMVRVVRPSVAVDLSHSSESELTQITVAATFTNNGTIADLHTQVRDWLKGSHVQPLV